MRFVLRNLAGNYLVYAASIVVGLALTPIVIRELGKTAFGVWAFIGSVAVFLRVLDLGLGPTLVRHSAYYRGRGQLGRIGELASSGLVLYAVIDAIVTGIGLLFAWVVPSLVDAPDSLVHDARVGALLVVATLALELPLGLFGNLMKGQQRYDLVNLGALVSLAVYAALVLAVLTARPSVVTLAAITLAVTLIRVATPALLVRRELPGLRLSRRLVSRARVRELLSFSGYAFVSHIAAKIVFSADAILIGIFLGARAVALYAVASRLFALGSGLAGTGSDLLLPAYSEAEGRADERRQAGYLLSGLRGSTAVAVLVAAPLLLLPGWVLRAWLGGGFDASRAPLILLAATLLFVQPTAVMSQYLLGRGRPRPLAVVQIVFGLVNLAVTALVLWVAGTIWSAALATLVLEGIVAAVALPLLLRTSGIAYAAVAGAWARVVAAALPAAAVTLVPAFFLWRGSGSLAGLLAVGVAWGAAFALSVWRVALGEPERRIVRRGASRLRGLAPEPGPR
jgi:O-antigen/teichoic acid export membrane protein